MAREYNTGGTFHDSEVECNPIIAHGVLYATTLRLRLIALNTTTGKLLWEVTLPAAGRRHTGNLQE